MRLHFSWQAEERPGPLWRALFDRTWPSYESWFRQEGTEARPDLSTCRAELERWLPELVPLWEELVVLAGGSDDAARMLSLVDPPAYLSGCSQAVWTRGRPFLVRNYDYRAQACEGVFLLSRWHDTTVLASSDCLWGALDGVNEHGLCVALSFGGRRVVGPGLGIPLIVRYVLEFCATVDDAAEVLRRVPSHMAYNVSLLDGSGDYAVARLSPDRPTEVLREAVSTNHQVAGEWSEYAELTRSGERARFLEAQIGKRQSAERFVRRFLEPPLYLEHADNRYGTLYTAIYRPDGAADFLWPHCRVEQSLDDFSPLDLSVEILRRSEGTAAR